MQKEFEKIDITNVYGHDKQKVIIEGEILLPEIKPDIIKVLQSDADIVISSIQVLNDKVIVTGQVDFKVIYLTSDETKKVSSISSTAEFTKHFDILGIKQGMNCEVKEELVYSYCSPISARKISAKAILDLSIQVKGDITIEYLKDVEDLSVKYLTEDVLVSNPISISETIDKKEILDLPQGKPSIREILNSYAKISEKNLKIDGKKISIDAKIDIKTMYSPDIITVPIETIEHEIYLNKSFEIPYEMENYEPMIKTFISRFEILPKTDEQGELRKLDCSIDIEIMIYFNKIEKILPIIDIYSISKYLKENKRVLNIDQFLGQTKQTWTLKDSANINDEMLEVFSTSGRIEVDSVRSLKNAIELKGVAVVFLIYLSKDVQNPLKSIMVQIPFNQKIEMEGVFEEDKAYANIDVENISFSIISSSEIEIRCYISAEVWTKRTRSIEIISDVEIEGEIKEEEGRLSHIYIYTVQKGDSLWKIAKKYKTTVEKIVAFNQIENENEIYPMQKLIIVKN